MLNTCQVTNQSSHGELSFHHNPHLQLAGAWAFLLIALFGAKAQDWKMQLTLVSVHCCELCALKQKPGVLLEKPISPSPSPVKKGKALWDYKNYQIPTADRTHHRIRSPSIKCSGT